MDCRAECGACCIAPSINHPLPGMPLGKPAGMPCVNLEEGSNRCRLWGSSQYPDTCHSFQAELIVCGSNRTEAMRLIGDMERATR